MMIAPIKQVLNISRPGVVPAPGDVIEIECVGGFVEEVDPISRRVRPGVHQRFRVGETGSLVAVAKRERRARQERPREPVIRVVDGVEYVVMFDGT